MLFVPESICPDVFKHTFEMNEEDFLQKIRLGFEELCRALNMDVEASNEAWRSYESISKKYTLEVCLIMSVVL